MLCGDCHRPLNKHLDCIPCLNMLARWARSSEVDKATRIYAADAVASAVESGTVTYNPDTDEFEEYTGDLTP